MFGLILASALAASVGCQERCAQESGRCYSGCNGAAQCSQHCGDRAATCNAQCAKDVKKAENAEKHKPMPCPNTEAGKPMMRPCTEAELKQFKEAMNSKEAKKALCKDAKGNLTPCSSEQREKTKEFYEMVKKDGACRDDNGNPTVCAKTKEKVEKSVSSRRMSR